MFCVFTSTLLKPIDTYLKTGDSLLVMARKDKFLLVSLQEEKAAQLAQVISNSTCRRILDYLSEHDYAAETQIAKELGVPLPTVHYNLAQLTAGGLVVVDEYHYSEKGKEINHYKLANQYIIIAPKSMHGFKEKLRSILPVVLAGLGITALLQLISKYLPVSTSMTEKVITESIPVVKQQVVETAPMMAEKVVPVAQEAVRVAADQGYAAVQAIEQDAVQTAVQETGRMAVEEGGREIVKETIVQQVVTEPSVWHSIALWFFLGVVFAIVLYFIVEKVRKR